MAKHLVPDELWAVVALLPPTAPAVGTVADRNGVRFGDDLLAAATRVTRGWGVASPAPSHAESLGRGRADWSRASLDAQSVPTAKGERTRAVTRRT